MKQVIIGVCGSRRTGRVDVVSKILEVNPSADDQTVSIYHRVPWGRADKLEEQLKAANAPVVVAGIKCLEEAMVVEALGGFVVHAEGSPSEEVPIKRDSILVTLRQPRGRYVSIRDMLTEVKRRAF